MSNIGSNNPNIGSLGIGKIGVGIYGVIESILPIGALVYYAFSLVSASEAILEQVGRASSLSTTRASNSVATYADGHTETYGTNLAALSDLGDLVQIAGTNEVKNSNLSGLTLTNVTRDIADDTTLGYVFTRLTESTDAGNHSGLELLGTAIPIGTFNASVVIKKDTRRWAFIEVSKTTSDFLTVVIDLNDQSIADTEEGSSAHTGVTLSVETLSAADDIYRYTISGTKATTNITTINVGMSDSASPTYSGGQPTYTGVATNTVLYAGLQAETGLYSSSLIPTTGAAVTRAVDDSTFLTTNIPVNNFKLEMEVIWKGSTANNARFLESNGDADDNFILRMTNTTKIAVVNRVGAANKVTTCTFSTAFLPNATFKVTLSKDASGTILVVENVGVETITTTQTTADSKLDVTWDTTMQVGNAVALNSGVSGIYKDILVTPL